MQKSLNPTNITALLGLFFALMICCCTGLSTGSYIAVYQGKLVGIPKPIDTTINIYGSDPPILRDGVPRDGFKPQHPDTNGFFTVGLTSPGYGELEDPPSH
jgi:hypothetical protein